jgi:peptidoglycan/LPS O-acetylase OafA/YrhL
MRRLDQSFSPRNNSLNFLRLVLAAAVVFSHSIILGAFGSETILGKTTLGTVAVYGFFAISGFLIARSASRNHVGRYLWQRFLRIFPAFWICLVVTAFLFGTIAWFDRNPTLSSSCGLHCYLNEPGGPIGYITNNLFLHVSQPTITNTLPNGIFRPVWNGSLWTLEFEFLCYLLLAVAAVIGLLRRRWWLASIALVLWLAEIIITAVPSFADDFSPSHNWYVMKLLAFVPIFLAGALIHAFQDKLPDSGVLALGSAALFLLGLFIPIGQGVPVATMTSLDLTAVFLAYPLVWLGMHLPLNRVGAINDYSYGIYIYAFPIQQLLLLWGLNRWGYVPYTALTFVALVPFAVGSWWLIEKRALRLKGVQLPKPVRSVLRLEGEPVARSDTAS